MGKIIVNWSPIHGQSATTSNTVALASIFSLDQPYRSLLTHTQASYSTMETMYNGKKKNGLSDSGVIALERLAKSKLLKPEAVSDYTETIYRSSLDFLPGSRGEYVDEESDKMIQPIIRAASQRYDFLWIDAHSGTANFRTNAMLKEADMVLVHLPQNKYILEQFFKDKGMPKELEGKPFFIILSQYDEQADIHCEILTNIPIQEPHFQSLTMVS